ncbi:MAG: hypothetical protein J7L43_03080 [Candidatus Aenigmarchaeota archaeon]|nr:hypothetical protein [Candidatus Aenigmarchaeota archaeon]
MPWDSENKPIGYIPGVSPGFARIGPVEKQLPRMGLARKLAEAARLGFEFAMIDFEELGEALEPDLVKLMKNIKETQGIKFGFHLPTDMDLCIANAYDWRWRQDQLVMGAKLAKEVGAKFILMHSSSRPRPNITAAFFGNPEYHVKLVGPDGTNFGDWVENHGLRDWFKAKFIKILYHAMGAPPDPTVVNFFEMECDTFSEGENKIKKIMGKAYDYVNEKIKELRNRGSELHKKLEDLEKSKESRDEINKIKSELLGIEQYLEEWLYKKRNLAEDLIAKANGIDLKAAAKYRDIYVTITMRADFDELFEYWKRNGSEGQENDAYLTVAYWLYKNKDPMWKYVVGEDRDPYYTAKKCDREMGNVKPKDIEFLKKVVTAVAGKYIEGHLKSKTPQYAVKDRNLKTGEIVYKSVYEFCDENKITIYIETNMPAHGAEGELRIIRAIDHINICKAIDGGKRVNYCIDFEHLLTNLIDPIKEARELAEKYPGSGKYITNLHVNAPRPFMGAHAPIEPISHDIYIIYKFMYYLKKAGMDNTYVIWEMGSYGVRQSAIAFRNIIKALTHKPEPIPPEELPPEFFGIDKNFKTRQFTTVRLHAFDPLRGLLHVPEEEWTMLGRAAVEKGKAREWEMRKYR